MRKKSENDFLQLLSRFQKKLDSHPTYQQMYEELRMMNFKIRPLQGDLSLFNLSDERLVELLWKLGKLDEFFQKEYQQLDGKEKNVLVRYIDSMHDEFQKQLNRLNLRAEKPSGVSSLIEMEIFKESTKKKSN